MGYSLVVARKHVGAVHYGYQCVAQSVEMIGPRFGAGIECGLEVVGSRCQLQGCAVKPACVQCPI